MKMRTEENQNPQPRISLIEKEENPKVGRFPVHKERVAPMGTPSDPEVLKKSKYDELFTEARKNILSDEDFFKDVIDAVLQKVAAGANKGLAEIQNVIIDKCINLKESDIDIIINQLDKKVLAFIASNRESLGISEKDFDKYVTREGRLHDKDRWQLNSSGIKSVVNFIRTRTGLLQIKPKQKFLLGSNDRLDSEYKTDLIEILFCDDGQNIDQLNLIQVKNSQPTEDEVRGIIKKHTDYANEKLMSIDDISGIKMSEEEQRKIFEETLGSQSTMFDKIFEICFDYKGMEQSVLIEKLGLGNLDILRRAWILQSYFKTMREEIIKVCEDDYVTEDSRDALIKDLEHLVNTSIQRSGILLNIVPINSVNSIIAVGPKIIKQVEIYNSQKTGKTLAASA